MPWKEISNISSILSVLGFIGSLITFSKTKKYYEKIADNRNFEKLSSVDRDLIDMRDLYDTIQKFHFIVDKRGANLQNIINSHLNIGNCLNKIRITVPSKYENILDSINKANEQIESINDKSLHNESNDYFKELGTYLTNIEDGIKSEKENIRGF